MKNRLSTGSSLKKRLSIGIRLQQMRAHVMRASLPTKYKVDQAGNKEKAYSAILYGPPGTGKTSLLQALALSSNVPLVMLSPSDLVVQGQEQLEGRAKAVFAALSMLSQTVILLDEFEPILRRRGPKSSLRGKQKPEAKRDGELSEVAKLIRDGSASMLQFLLTGMLPKLVSLHEAAEEQSLVYCLATNHMEEIDEAAKRSGRFDIHQPIFNPDPISRAGTFLFRLLPIAKYLNQNVFFSASDKDRQLVLAKIIAATVNESAGELSRKFFRAPKLDKSNALLFEDRKRSFFAHILGEGLDPEDFYKKLRDMMDRNFHEMEREFEEAKARLDEDNDEMLEHEWLFGSEKRIRSEAENVNTGDLLNRII